MNTSAKYFLIFLFALFVVSLVSNCENDDDDNDNDNDNDSAAIDDDASWEECRDNQPPEILGLQISVNGEVVQEPVEVVLYDKVELALEYVDPDCNLEGGA
ncbi:MAG: hypothetical protein GX444_03530 [Myxococcales bacterium]|nr:hypothetical protein [Myxococcales bacterium]